MSRLLRVMCVFALVFSTVGPLRAATADPVATISGKIRDLSGAPVASATVTARGPKSAAAESDAQGNFSIGNLMPGVYQVTVSKAGYQTAVSQDIAVLGGVNQSLDVALQAVTLTSLKTIGSVVSHGRGTFNTTPASTSVISAQTFLDQAQPQVMQILNQTPGIVASHPGGSSNGAVPGSITFPNIRGSLSFETASLIDGHPISVGSYGDYVTTFLNSFVLGGVEVVKGPGASAPETNYAIGGTVNFRTKDPTYTPTGNLVLGQDSFGGTVFNLGHSGTTRNGKLGWVLDYASNNTGGPFNNYPAYFVPNGGQIANGGANVDGQDYQGNAPANVFQSSVPYNGTSLVACCQILQSTFKNTMELAKLQYHFSPSTVATVSYLGSQTVTDQNANISSRTYYTFDPASAGGPGAPPNSPPAPYTGGLPTGIVALTNFFPGQETEYNNEPIFQGEIRTTLGKDSLLFRGYTATIDRLTFQGGDDPNVPITQNLALYGTAYDGNGNPVQTFNGEAQPVQFFAYYHQFELDQLKGYSAEYDHNIGSNTISLAYDHTHSSTYSGAYQSDSFDAKGYALNYNVPSGSSQDFGTFLLRGIFYYGDKFHVTLSNYLNTYRSTYPVNCVGGCPTFYGSDPVQFIFQTSSSSHYDGRVGLEYRPSPTVALRLSMGSAIAPPYLYILSRIPRGLPSYNRGGGFGTQTVNAGNLKPETAFGYDLGGDVRSKNSIDTLSFDLYSTNLFNQYIQATSLIGTCTPAGRSCKPDPNGTKPLYGTGFVNLSNARYQGLELAFHHDPALGLGFTLQGALQKAYPYNLGPCFYIAGPCGDPKSPSTNLAIIGNQNFTSGVGGSANGVSNQNIPYSQAYGALRYRFDNGVQASFGETLFGKNNSLNQPAFWVADGSLRVAMPQGASIQLTGYNLFDAHSEIFPVEGAGVPLALQNGQIGLTLGNVIGPRKITLLFVKNWGSSP